MKTDPDKNLNKTHIVFFIAALSVLIAASGYFYYRHGEKAIRQEKENELKAIAELKMKQIAEWHKDELNDAAVISKNSFLIDAVKKYLNGKGPGDRAALVKHLNQIKAEHGYKDIILSSIKGKLLASTDKALQHVDTSIVKAAKQAVKQQKSFSTDIYRCSAHGVLQINFVSALTDKNGSAFAVMIFQMSPEDFLYPIIEFWPTSSRTSETYIARREQDEIIVLNKLRHLDGPAFSHRYSLNDKETEVVKAVQGHAGFLDARDYRGVDVLAYAGHVPDTPWFMVAKVDKDEIFEESYFKIGTIITFIVLLILLSTTGLLFVHNKRSEQELRKSEELYRNLFENHSAVKLMIDPDTGSIIDANDAAVRFYGWPRERLRQMRIQEINTLPDDELMKEIEKVRTQKRNHFEFRHRRADGSVRDVEVFSSRIEAKGREILHSIIHDTTERKQAEEALRKSEARLKKSQEMAKLGNWSYDMSGPILWSDEMYRIYGVSPETFTPDVESFIGLIHHDDRSAMRAWIKACASGEKPGEMEFRAVLPDGAVRFIRGGGELICDPENRPLYMSGTAQDITEHCRLEDQLRHAQKLEGIGQLAGGIAHDFNNVLNAVVGYAGLLRMKMDSSDPLAHYADEILSAGQRGAALTHQILAFSRKQVLDMKHIELNEVIKSIEKMLHRLVREDIHIKLELFNKPLVVFADAGQIDQVLINLATNARDSMPEGGQLTIETKLVKGPMLVEKTSCSEPSDFAEISVTDTGCGMDAETLYHIFEPFFTTKAVGKGTGLGLAVAHGIVRQHNGHIEAYSEIGRGTVFKIFLPLSNQMTETIGTSPALQVRGGTETILVAEDDASLRNLSTIVLCEYGYKVIGAVDGEDAIRKFLENKDSISLVVLDGIMPKKNGKEVFDEILKLSPDIKAIFMSGYAEDIFTHGGLLENAVTFVPKPVKPDDLLRIVREELDRQ
ncbi:MAG: PAS domain S-box protein [Nitrospirae bacterium]|nr:MAG: PAS domain S-box protein [Nitrospirota bacterium]